MNGVAHTKGWLPFRMNSSTILTTRDRRGFHRCAAVDSAGDIVAETRGKTEDEAQARVLLIAAAPDLKDAAGKATTVLVFEGEQAVARGDTVAAAQIGEALKALRAAILKAQQGGE